MIIPRTIILNEDKLKFLYRAKELLRLEHNTKGNDFSNGKMSEKDFRDYQKYDFESRNQKLFEQINELKEKLDLVKNYAGINGTSPNLIKAQSIKENGSNASEFDKNINLMEI